MTAATLTRPASTARNWRANAACTGTDPDLYWPTRPDTIEGTAQINRALNVCSWCVVQPDCLAWALTAPLNQRGGQVVGGRWFDQRGRAWVVPPAATETEPDEPAEPKRRYRQHDKAECPECGRTVALHQDGTFRPHSDGIRVRGTWATACPGVRPTDPTDETPED